MTPLNHRVWFVRWTPSTLIQLHPTLSLTKNDGEGWFEKLVKDINANGLNNPIVVHNQTMPCDDVIPCRIIHGSNRYRAVRRLGWKYVPTLIVGTLPKSLLKGAVELHSIEECQSYLTDGTFVNHKTGCKVFDANYAETGIYLRNAEPYKDKE